jgi:hypothetical protein
MNIIQHMTNFPHVYDLQTKTIAPQYCIGQYLTTTLATRCTYWINVFYYNKDPRKHHFRLSDWNIALEDPQHLTHKVLLPKKHVFINIIIKMIVYFTHNDINAREREFLCKSLLFPFKPFIWLWDLMENHASWDNAYDT